MSYSERWTMVGLVVVTMALFLWVMRQQWSLWCFYDAHEGRKEKGDENLRDRYTRLCKVESQIVAMNRTYQERFDGVNQQIAEYEDKLTTTLGAFKALDDLREDVDRRIGLVDEQLARLERLREESSLRGKTAMGRIEEIAASFVKLEQKQAPDDFKDWRQNVGQMVTEHASILDGILGKLDATDRRLANWPTEIRSEVATAYRDMADAIDRAELAEASA